MKPLVTIATFSSVIDARLAQARLEGTGMRTFLPDESFASLDPLLIPAMGGVRLQVESDDETAAREILGRPLEEPPVEMDEVGPFCPRCDSEYVFGTERMTCKRCGFQGLATDFASTDARRKARVARKAAVGASERRPVFRLERHRGLVGGVIGFAAGVIVTAFVGRELGVFGFLIGILVGTALGRTSKYWVCSEPSCRGDVGRNDPTCGKCGRSIGGFVTEAREHFIRVAEWERERASKNGAAR